MAIGWLLGHPLDLEAATPLASARVPVSRDAPGFQAQLDDWLHRFGGRFAAVLLAPVPLVYPDAGGTLPVLFDPELQAAASSPFLLVREGEEIPDSELVDTVAVFRTGGWFTLGATPHAGASLLLPNHVLDLRTWKQARVWPRERPEEADVASSVERVAVALERTLAAAAATGTPNVGFTAGGDSRTFVACARDILDRFRFITVAFPDELGAVDLATAPALAQRLGLEHRVLPWLEPSADDVELFMYRTGCLVGERRGRLAGPTYNQFGGAETYVSGIGAEMARGIGWRRDDEPGSELSADGLLSRFHLRHETYNLDAEAEISRWLSEGRIDLFAFNDHMDSTVANLTKPQKRSRMVERTGLSGEAFDDLVARVVARAGEVPASIARLAEAARSAGVRHRSRARPLPAERDRYDALSSRRRR